MFGWRARLGLLVPSSNTTNEPEFHRTLPRGVELYTARLELERVEAAELAAMEESAGDAADTLAHADVDVIAYGCTTGSLVKGHEYAAELESTLADRTDVPVVATALSVERALESLDVERVSVVTPYIEELNDREREFLEEGSFEVTTIEGHGIERNLDIGALTPERAYQQASAAADWTADAVFVSCTNYRTLPIIEQLETDFDTPVVTSNQATLWDALRAAGVDYSDVDLGQLFER